MYRIGYEISFTRYFYKPKLMRPLDEIRADILALEQETEGLLAEDSWTNSNDDFRRLLRSYSGDVSLPECRVVRGSVPRPLGCVSR